MSRIAKISRGLATYNGRDSCIRVTAYFFLFLYGLLNDIDKTTNAKHSWLLENLLIIFSFEQIAQIANSCRIISKNFATTRLIMRFFDDIPALNNFYQHYLNAFKAKTDKNNNKIPPKSMHPYVKWVTTINLFFWIMYNPCEHLGWLGELKIINVDDQLWYFWTNVAWAGGLFTSVILNLNVVYLFYNQVQTKAQREDDKNYDSSKVISQSQMNQAALIAFRDFLDWCIAIHFMPEGFLWSAQLYHYQVGLIGVVSSLCRVHTYVINRQE